MPKFLWQISYSPQGAQGLQKDGGSARRSMARELCEKSGGKLEAFYFALGESDAYAIVDLPDVSTATAVSLAVNAAGAARLRTVQLFSPEEMDVTVKKAVDYRPPGAR